MVLPPLLDNGTSSGVAANRGARLRILHLGGIGGLRTVPDRGRSGLRGLEDPPDRALGLGKDGRLGAHGIQAPQEEIGGRCSRVTIRGRGGPVWSAKGSSVRGG
jgi:hypothetical protein